MRREDFGLEAHEPEGTAASGKALTIKDMNEEERPQERALTYGIQSLTTAELLALILRVGQPGMPITDLCRQLMNDNENSLLRLERRTREELMLTRGIGKTKALQVEAIMEIMRRYQRETVDYASGKTKRIYSSKDIHERMRYRIANLDHEEIWVILLNNKNDVIKEFCVTSGSAVASVFDCKMIIKRALLENATGLAMCHNHPSGNLMSSPQDDQITRKLKEACRSMDIRMLDHVIVTVAGFYSYSDEGRL